MANKPPRRRLRRGEVVLRDHEYDGIREFDQRLPNWWLYTLYGAIVFSVAYWFILYQADDGSFQRRQLDQKIESIQAARLAALDSFDDATLWEMSRNNAVVAQGKEIYTTHCQACHMESLRGADVPGGIGENLVDGAWKYGGNPTEAMQIVLKGSPDLKSGMQAWEAQLGARNVAAVVAYVMSYHEPR